MEQYKEAPLQLSFFHNTTGLRGEELKQARLKANSQAMMILQFFRQHPEGYFTPFDVRRALNLDPLQITEVRRSITDLTNAKPPFLIKTKEMREGDRGSMNHTWKLA
jgi:hypothetical protein